MMRTEPSPIRIPSAPPPTPVVLKWHAGAEADALRTRLEGLGSNTSRSFALAGAYHDDTPSSYSTHHGETQLNTVSEEAKTA